MKSDIIKRNLTEIYYSILNIYQLFYKCFMKSLETPKRALNFKHSNYTKLE